MTRAAGSWAILIFVLATRSAAQTCAADLDRDGRVTIDELVGFTNQSNGIDERMDAVVDALTGCPLTPTPTASPTPSPTSTSTPLPIIVRGNQSLNAIINNAPPGSTIIFAAGQYSAVALKGADHGPLTIIADEEGVLVQDAIRGEVTVLGSGVAPAIDLEGQSNITLQGFQLRGGRPRGGILPTLRIVNSPGTVIRHCKITDSDSDGVLVDGSDDIILFNNAIYENSGSAIHMFDARFVQIYNNTIYHNGGAGIEIGNSLPASTDVLVRNNITSANQTAGIDLDPASPGIDSDFNLVNDGLRGIAAGAHDIVGNGPQENPLFTAPERADFHMAKGIAASVSPAIDTGDPLTPAAFLAELRIRTTEQSRLRDTGNVDMGYHYPFAIVATPTPNPTLTPTPTKVRRATAG